MGTCPKNPVENQMKTHFENSSQPFEVVLFPKIWKFRKFSVPFDITIRYESTPVPVVVPDG